MIETVLIVFVLGVIVIGVAAAIILAVLWLNENK